MNHSILVAHMRTAIVYASLSRAPDRKVGCVVVKDDTIIGIGYNGTPPGWDNNTIDKYGRTKPEVFHAEQNAIDKITRSTISSVGAALFTTLAPCFECSKRIVGAKIIEVYYLYDFKSDSGIDFLNKNNIYTFKLNESEVRGIVPWWKS